MDYAGMEMKKRSFWNAHRLSPCVQTVGRSPFGAAPDASLVTAARPAVREGGLEVTASTPETSNRARNAALGLIKTMPRLSFVST